MTNDEIEREIETAMHRQVGGSHYKDMAIQPVEFIHANDLGFLPGCVIKRVCRYDKPTGKGIQDIEKAIHELELLKMMLVEKRRREVTQGNTDGAE